VNDYNNSIHSTIQTTPKLAWLNPSLIKIKKNIWKVENIKVKVNDRVKIFKYKKNWKKI